MRLLFISYWSLEDPLTIATVLPQLMLLQERANVELILLTTIERGTTTPVFEPAFPVDKIIYRPLISVQGRPLLLTKIDDFTRFPQQLTAWVKELGITVLLARGAPAGALAHTLHRRLGLPYYVESFEPHSEVMRGSGTWRAYDPRYLFQRRWENQQKKAAAGLLPVAENYRQKLLQEGVPAGRLITVPCTINLEVFAFSSTARTQMRSHLQFGDDDIVGIYVGKFGGIYYDQEAFDLFGEALRFFGARFRLVVLTANDAAQVGRQLTQVGFAPAQYFVTKAPHDEVPAYLSAADIAFATIKPADYLRYCSPIKVGEYWANGLPVLLTEGVGDDSDIIQREGGGAIFNLSRAGSVAAGLARMAEILHQPQSRTEIQALAVRYRSPERARRAYETFFGSIS